MKNKKGVEINITTIIILVLAILVLVIIALYFTGGMKTLWDQIRGTGSIYNQKDVDAAKALCQTKDKQAYCTEPIQLYNTKDGQSYPFYCWGSKIGATLRDVDGSVLINPSLTADGSTSEGKPSGCDGYF